MDMVDRIFASLSQKGATARAMAEFVGVSTGNVSDWKARRSKPSADAISRISEFLDISADYLLTGKESTAGLDPAQRELLEQWDQLDDAGRTMVKATVIQELRRMGG